MVTTLTNTQARRIVLAAQGFTSARPTSTPNIRHLRRVLGHTQLFQVDSVYVLERAHYLPAYSRLGAYSHQLVDHAAYQPERELFEYWGHAASLLPVELYPLMRWRMAAAEQHAWAGMVRVVAENPGLVDRLYRRIETEGGMTARQLDDGAPRDKNNWGWNWTDTKHALEWMCRSGQISVAARPGFERVYDLTERVIPKKYFETPAVDRAEAHRHLMLRSVKALGVATEIDLRDYFRLAPGEARNALNELVADGTVNQVEVTGWDRPAYLLPETTVPRKFPAHALISPFDPLVWHRDRTQRLWDFFYRIEIYVPRAKRIHGYYVLPFLWGEHLAARVDLKADRKAGVLQIPAAWQEARFDTAKGELAEALAAELITLATWLGLSDVAPPESGDLKEPLTRALRA